MVLRFTVIGLVVLNVFLWGLAALQPERADTENSQQEAARIIQISGLPSIRLASEASLGMPGGTQDFRQCYTLGPIASRSDMRRIRDELERSVVQLSWHETNAVVEQGYWVYLEPFSSFEQAAEAVEQLVAHGVRDYYVMPRGTYANAISVGLFEQESQAKARMAQIEALNLGWPLAMGMQRQDEARFWLDFEIRSDSDDELDTLIAGNGETRHLEVPCPENEASFPPT
jgi:hypothetical protein